MKIKVLGLAFLLLICLYVDGANVITLDSCRVQARRNYPLISQYHLIALSEEYSIQNAARSWIPKLYVSAQATYQSDAANMGEVWSSMGLEGILQQMGREIPDLYMRKFQGKVQVDIQQTLWDGGKSAADKQVANAEAKVDHAAADVEFYNLERRVDNIFFGILLLDEQFSQVLNLEHLLEENLQRARSLYNNNVILQNDVDAVEVEYLAAGQRKEQIESSRRAYRQMLSLLIGYDISNDTLECPAMIVDPNHSQDERPEVTLLQARKDLITAQRKNILSLSMPQFSAFASGWYGYPTLNMFKAMQSSEWGLNGMIGIKMSWNVSAFYTQDNRLKQLDLKCRQLDLQHEVFSFNRELQKMQGNGDVERLSRTLQQDEKIVRLRRSVREAAESQYRNGIITTSDLLQKITDENNARMTQTIHQIEYLKTQYELIEQ